MRVVIVGVGEVGYHIAEKLSREHKDVIVIDRDPDRLKHVSETLDVAVLEGAGSDPTLLLEAGLKSADMLVAVTDSDEANLLACLTGRILSPNTIRIARIRNPAYRQMEEFIGLSLVIHPEYEVVGAIERLLEVPGAVDVIDFAGGLVRLIGLKIGSTSSLTGLSMIELREIDPDRHILVVAIYRENRVIIPHGGTRLESGDLVYVAVRPQDIKDALNYFGLTAGTVSLVFIVGAGQVGTMLAERLEKRGIKVKLIERDKERCRLLGQVLDKTVVLQGDGTDKALLLEENAADADFFIALTNDEEENTLSCLLARHLGAKRTITRINKLSYIPLLSAIGLETLVSSRLSAVSAILRNTRRGKVVSAVAIKGEDAEAIEFETHSESQVVGKPLKDIRFPRQALIAAIVRDGTVTIPGGLDVIQARDHIIIFTKSEAVPKVEKALSVKGLFDT